MEFNIEILVRDLSTFAMILGSGTVVKKIDYTEEDKKGAIDNLRIKLEVDNPHTAFRLGQRFGASVKPFTQDELDEMEARYEYENDL